MVARQIKSFMDGYLMRFIVEKGYDCETEMIIYPNPHQQKTFYLVLFFLLEGS